jgi:hypothetical protein
MKMKMKRIATITLGLGLLATPAVMAGDYDPQGHLYGTVVTDGDRSYTGFLRWGTEETFWDDHFNSTKEDLPYLEEHRQEKRRRNKIKIFGFTVGYRWEDYQTTRMFIARFGDIDHIDVRRGQKIKVTMKDGSVFDMEGGSNDVGATVTVWDDTLGEVDIEWEKIDSVDFKPTPASAEPPGRRLYGRVETGEGTFKGYIQWDLQECLTIDKLDGETDDGDLSIEMGKIRSIEKRNRRGSNVELTDGREFVLEGTNDVNSSLRGINVEDERYGRLKISWDAFERVDFEEAPDSGNSYDSYKGSGPLTGSITDYDGGSHSGRMIYDLDEEAGWELLNGSLEGIELNIPFEAIRSIEPQKDDESKVVLKNGEELVLHDGQDVSERNDGIVVFRDNGRERHIPWDQVQQVQFD